MEKEDLFIFYELERKKEMRAGQTVHVCGAGGHGGDGGDGTDDAQFAPFVWPRMCLLRTPLGLVGEAACARAVAPGSSARERRTVARAYVDATRASRGESRDEPRDESRTDAVVSWLIVVEGVTRVRCALALSRGALTIEAVPYYIARIRNSRLRVHGPDVRATVPTPNKGGPADPTGLASSALAMFAAGIIPVPTREALCASFCFVYRSPHVHELHPRPTCAMCGGMCGAGAAPAARIICSHHAMWTRDSAAAPLPTINVCGAPLCSQRRAFSVLGLFAFTLDAPTSRLEPLAPTEGMKPDARLGPLAPLAPLAPVARLGPLAPLAPRDTIWMAHMRIALEFARIMFRAAGHVEDGEDGANVGRCAATAAMRDMKLCRMVVDSIASASPVSALPLSATDHHGQIEQTEQRSILALVWY